MSGAVSWLRRRSLSQSHMTSNPAEHEEYSRLTHANCHVSEMNVAGIADQNSILGHCVSTYQSRKEEKTTKIEKTMSRTSLNMSSSQRQSESPYARNLSSLTSSNALRNLKLPRVPLGSGPGLVLVPSSSGNGLPRRKLQRIREEEEVMVGLHLWGKRFDLA